MLLYQLLRPLAYIAIRDESKWKIDVALPLLFAGLMVTAFALSPFKLTVFGSGGVLSLLIGLLQILPGFYLTALAAVATFNRPDMDELMPSPSPTMQIKLLGRKQRIALTRRRMLSMLFGYLTFITFGLYGISVLCQFVADGVRDMIPLDHRSIVVGAFILLYNFIMGQIIFITMFALYQLADRMHQPD